MEKKEKNKEILEKLLEWVDAVNSAIVLCILIFTFVIKSCYVDGISMAPTYVDGDRFIVISPYCNLSSGDVVTTDKNNGTGKQLCKRIVATEYQYVSMDQETGAIYIDGVLFEEPIATTVDNIRGDMEYPFYVPKGCVFVMGDNRGVSNDSRYTEVGFIDARCVIGKLIEKGE